MSPTTMPQSTTPVVGYEVDTVSSTTDVFRAMVAADPNRPLVAKPAGDGWSEVTAGQFLDEVRAAAKGLISMGVEPGDRIAIFGPTSYEWTLSDYAVWFAGGISVPFYDTSSEAQLAWMIEDAAVERGLVSTREHADAFTAAAAAAGLPAPKLRVWEEGAFADLAEAGREITD
ncbi:MAG TPA: AMP-binding protein, partial [Candidatus Brevibacterium intestinavium]|nr:AMP-binding protein [Candidatus Brevibacterium intestinavium]